MNFNIRYQFVTIFIFFYRLCQLIGLIGLLLLSSGSQTHKISVSHFLLHSGYWIQLRLNVREYRASVRSSSSYRSCRCTSTTRTTATVRLLPCISPASGQGAALGVAQSLLQPAVADFLHDWCPANQDKEYQHPLQQIDIVDICGYFL